MNSSSYTDLVDVLQQSVAEHGQRNLFGTRIDGSWRWTTYAEFGRRVDDLRGGLADVGIGEGDTVAVISGNRVEWAVLAYAAYGLGARLCPMYESQREEDWEYILGDSGAKLLVTSTYAIYEAARGWTRSLDALDNVFCMALPEEDVASFLSLEKRGREKPAAVVEIDPEAVCGFLYTSGTTGKPKGVRLTHNNITSNINGVAGIFPIDHSDISVAFLPWAHSFGHTCELHCLLSRGACIAINQDVDRLVDDFSEVRPTLLYAVPRIFNRIYDGVHKQVAEKGGLSKLLFDRALANEEKREALEEKGKTSTLAELRHAFYDKLVFSKVRDKFGGRLKFAISGGAALSGDVAEFIDRLGVFVCEGYGLTETSPIVTANHPGARKMGSVGKPLPGVEVLLDKKAADLEEGEDGEILVKGPNVMQGYHNLPDETDAVMTDDGAFRTGDMGRLDSDGFLYITGRIKEQYKLENGKYVVPAPLEELLQLSPYISQAFLYGDNKPFNIVLVVPDREAVEKWADKKGVAGDYSEILEDDATRELMREEIEEHGDTFKGYEKPKEFALLEEEFTVENGLLTPKMSVKRRKVIEEFGDLVDSLYDDHDDD